MPGLNRKGPENMGPMTGRKMGRCARPKSETDDFGPMNEVQGRGRGLGLRRGSGPCGGGRGRGFGRNPGQNPGRGAGAGRMSVSSRQSQTLSDE